MTYDDTTAPLFIHLKQLTSPHAAGTDAETRKILSKRLHHLRKGLSSVNDNPADCVSRELFPSELLQHSPWWNGPDWLLLDLSRWPQGSNSHHSDVPDEEREVCLINAAKLHCVIPLTRYSSLTHLTRVTAWMLRFINNCHARCRIWYPPLNHSLSPS